MADQTPANDPLGDRLRTTFRAEHADLERRANAREPRRPASRASRAWMPLAAVAAAIVIAGFVISGVGSTDQAQDLDLAGESPDTGGDSTNESDGEPTVTGSIPVVPPTPEPVQPLPSITVTPFPSPTVVPVRPPDVRTSTNNCAEGADVSGPWFVWGIYSDDPDGGLVGHTEPGIDAPVTRILELNEVVTRASGCSISSTGSPWFELQNGAQPDWASGRFLIQALPACLVGEQFGSRTSPNERIPDNSYVYVVEAGDTLGSIANKFAITMDDLFLANPDEDATALTVGSAIWIPGQSSDAEIAVGPLDGHAVVDGNHVAFAPAGSSRYRWYGRDAVGNAACPGGVIDDFFPDDLASRPCAINGLTPPNSEGSAGSAASTADHVHNLRVEATPGCIRVVVEFGSGAWTDNDVAVNLVPIIQVTKTGGSSELRFNLCNNSPVCPAFSAGEGEPQRIDFPGGTAFIAIDEAFQPYVKVLADGPRSSITIMENPARVVIDIEPLQAAPTTVDYVAGERAILATPVVRDTGRPIVFANSPISVSGFARPFETVGGWHIFQANSDGTLPAMPVSVASGFLQTTGWTEGWGEFEVQLPGLEPGTYIATFGEAPPSGDDVTFWGTGQWFVVPEPDDERGRGDFPVISHIDVVVEQPILVLD